MIRIYAKLHYARCSALCSSVHTLRDGVCNYVIRAVHGNEWLVDTIASGGQLGSGHETLANVILAILWAFRMPLKLVQLSTMAVCMGWL